MTEKKHLPPRARTPDEIEKSLANFDQRFTQQVNAPPPKRRNRRTPTDPYGQAKYAAEKALRFFQMVMVDEGLVNHPPVAGVTAAMEVVFATELFWLNILNADNLPATPEQIAAAREAAYQYYAQNRDRAVR